MATSLIFGTIEQHALNVVNNCLNTNIFAYLENSVSQSSSLYLKVVHFLTPVLIRHLWQLKIVIFLYWCRIHFVLLIEKALCAAR